MKKLKEMNFDTFVAMGALIWYMTHPNLVQVHQGLSGFISFWGILSAGWLFHMLVIRWDSPSD